MRGNSGGQFLATPRDIGGKIIFLRGRFALCPRVFLTLNIVNTSHRWWWWWWWRWRWWCGWWWWWWYDKKKNLIVFLSRDLFPVTVGSRSAQVLHYHMYLRYIYITLFFMHRYSIQGEFMHPFSHTAYKHTLSFHSRLVSSSKYTVTSLYGLFFCGGVVKVSTSQTTSEMFREIKSNAGASSNTPSRPLTADVSDGYLALSLAVILLTSACSRWGLSARDSLINRSACWQRSSGGRKRGGGRPGRRERPGGLRKGVVKGDHVSPQTPMELLSRVKKTHKTLI